MRALAPHARLAVVAGAHPVGVGAGPARALRLVYGGPVERRNPDAALELWVALGGGWWSLVAGFESAGLAAALAQFGTPAA